MAKEKTKKAKKKVTRKNLDMKELTKLLKMLSAERKLETKDLDHIWRAIKYMDDIELSYLFAKTELPQNLERKDLRFAYMRGRTLRNANLRYADLRYADLRDADLTDANLRGALLNGASFFGAKLDNATLTKLEPATVFGFRVSQIGESYRLFVGDKVYPVTADQTVTHLNSIMEDFNEIKFSLFPELLNVVLSLPEADTDNESVPLWLKYDVPPSAEDVALAISNLSKFSALIRICHRELSSIPSYATSISTGSPWDEKQMQEQEERIAKLIMKPLSAIPMEERLRLYRVFEGSISLGLGRMPKWLMKKLSQAWEIIPKWKIANAKAEKIRAEAGKIDAQKEQIKEQTKTIGPKSEAEIAKEWEEVYDMQQRRAATDFQKRLEFMSKVLEKAPPEHKNLPPKAVMLLLNEIISCGDNSSNINNFGKILLEDELEKLPPIEIEGKDDDDPELV